MSNRPKPTAIKELEGNPGKRAINHDEPKVPKGVPEMPKGMGTAAKRHWRIFVRELMTVGVLSIVDGIALAEACKCAALAEKYFIAAQKEPMVQEIYFNKEGEPAGTKWKPNPAMPAYIMCSKNMKQYLIEFGLTPSSRTKLRIEKPKDEGETLAPREPYNAAATQETAINLDDIDETVIN